MHRWHRVLQNRTHICRDGGHIKGKQTSGAQGQLVTAHSLALAGSCDASCSSFGSCFYWKINTASHTDTLKNLSRSTRTGLLLCVNMKCVFRVFSTYQAFMGKWTRPQWACAVLQPVRLCVSYFKEAWPPFPTVPQRNFLSWIIWQFSCVCEGKWSLTNTRRQPDVTGFPNCTLESTEKGKI